MNKTTCKLDRLCTSIIMQDPQYFIHVYVYIINLCFSSCVYPTAFKSAKVNPLLTQRTFFEDMSTFFLHDILRALQILLTVRLSGYV